MALTKYKLGELIKLEDDRNSDGLFTLEDVKGISIQKRFIETKADMQGVSLSPYILVKPDFFAYVTVTSRNGEKITLAHNTTNNTYIVSSSYVVFSVSSPKLIDSDYLFMFFNRPEFDRYSRYNSWGSARETFSWDDMRDIDIELPDLTTQRKYVEVYKSLLSNQQSYERGLDDLKLVCDGYIEDLRRKTPCEKIGDYLIASDRRNNIGLDVDAVRGIATSKELIPTKADMDGVGLTNYKLVPPQHIAYVPDTSRRGDKISLAMNRSQETYMVSSISTVFTTNTAKVLPEYLMLFFKRTEFDRYSRFNSWGSAREAFEWDAMCDFTIPIPQISVQKAIAEISTVYNQRKEINEKLKSQIKDICPILIKGSIEEAKKEA